LINTGQPLAGRRSFRAVVRTKEFNEVGMRSVANLEKGIARLTDEQRAELWNSALSRNLDRATDMPQDSVDDVAAIERPRRPKKRTPIDDENEDFSQNTYSE
jgi:DNA primase large subunit